MKETLETRMSSGAALRHPGGMKDISRGLSVSDTPGQASKCSAPRRGARLARCADPLTPLRGAKCVGPFRGYRSAHPPATLCHPSRMRTPRSATNLFTAPHLSLAPGFSRVSRACARGNRFNGFPPCAREAAEAAGTDPRSDTRLKPGANENKPQRSGKVTYAD